MWLIIATEKSQTVIIKSLICCEAKFSLYWTFAERITTLQFIVASSNVPDGRELARLLYQFIPGSTIRQTFSISATSRSVILCKYQTKSTVQPEVCFCIDYFQSLTNISLLFMECRKMHEASFGCHTKVITNIPLFQIWHFRNRAVDFQRCLFQDS